MSRRVYLLSSIALLIAAVVLIIIAFKSDTPDKFLVIAAICTLAANVLTIIRKSGEKKKK